MMAVTPLVAQMHGGSRGGGFVGRGGFSSSGGSGFHGGASFGVTGRSGGSFGGWRQPGFSSGRSSAGIRQPFRGSRYYGRRNWYPAVSPYYSGYYGYPAYYGSYGYTTADYYSPYDYYGPSYAYAAPADSVQDDIARQQRDIDRLEDEVDSLRAQREARNYAPASPAAADNRVEVSTPTVLVFRDKHTQEVQNYAVVGGTLWIFNEQKATKLPLSWLDIEATTKANDDRGVSFQLPK